MGQVRHAHPSHMHSFATCYSCWLGGEAEYSSGGLDIWLCWGQVCMTKWSWNVTCDPPPVMFTGPHVDTQVFACSACCGMSTCSCFSLTGRVLTIVDWNMSSLGRVLAGAGGWMGNHGLTHVGFSWGTISTNPASNPGICIYVCISRCVCVCVC